MPWLSKVAGSWEHEARRATGRIEAGDEEWADSLEAPQGNAGRGTPGGFVPLSPDGQQTGATPRRVGRREWEKLQEANSGKRRPD